MIEEVTKRPSAMVLIIANLIPLAGVLFWNWDVFSIVVLYWMENVVLGVINVLKMITCRPDVEKFDTTYLLPGGKGAQRAKILQQLSESGGIKTAMAGHAALKFFMIPFFCVHYFGFCAGHGLFVFALFGQRAGFARGGSEMFSSFGRIPELFVGSFGLAAIGLIVSHLYSFVTNYLGRGEYQKTIVPVLMFKPYGRIVVLHIAIIFGGFLVMSLGSPAGLLLIMIVGKIGLDLAMHLREHREAPSGDVNSAIGG